MKAVLDLSRNEGPLPPADCLRGLEAEGSTLLRDYVESEGLEVAIAGYLGVAAECVLATTGGDDALDRIFRAYVGPHRNVVVPVPTFEMMPAFARMTGARLVPVEYEWGTLPVDALLAAVDAETGLVVVISPDNPTGAAAPTAELLRLARALPEGVPLLVDQAYVEFADEDPARTLLSESDVILVRTLSKAFGLAGMRIGYAVSDPDRIRDLRDIGGPYPLSGIGIRVALHQLGEGLSGVRRFVAENRTRRVRLAALLEGIGAAPLPSQTNFVFARVPEARWIHAGLAAQGVRTRFFEALPDYLRITVPRTDEEFGRLEGALRALRRPDALLFDMDGVLVDVRRSYRSAIKETCLVFGVRVEDADIARVKAAGNANDDWEVTRSLLERAGVDVGLDEVKERFEGLYQGSDDAPGLRRHECLIPSRELLMRLAGSVPLGVVTGRPRRDAERFLAESEIGSLFASVICREDARLKPSPEPVRAALEDLGVETAWLLGDTPDDIGSALGAGVVPVGVVSPGGGPVERSALEGAGAARIVDATHDFGGLFDELR